MSIPATPSSDSATHYTPGHGKRKLLIVVVGCLIFAYGWSELWPSLSLFISGKVAIAEATRVIKSKRGLPDQVLTDDLHVNAAEELKDRSYIFWNEFRFATPDGAEHNVRLPIGSQLKPLFPLLDAEGTSTTVPLYYDPQDPARICVPSVLSTWFAPGLVTLMGLLCAAIGLVLFYHSRKEIALD